MDYKIISKQGEREVNEDAAAVFECDKRIICVLADGLGGHGYGEVASKILVDSANEVFETNVSSDESIENLIKQIFEKAQNRLFEKQKEEHDFSSYKTTAVILAIDDKFVQWGYIGDSRLYYFQGKKLVKRTLDHSVPQMLVNAGKLKEKKIRGHIDRNKLLRVLGVEYDTPKYEIENKLIRQKEMTFLLCSDGFWEWIEEKSILKLLKKHNKSSDWLEAMEEEVLRNGKEKNMDNYSAIAIRI